MWKFSCGWKGKECMGNLDINTRMFEGLSQQVEKNMRMLWDISGMH